MSLEEAEYPCTVIHKFRHIQSPMPVFLQKHVQLSLYRALPGRAAMLLQSAEDEWTLASGIHHSEIREEEHEEGVYILEQTLGLLGLKDAVESTFVKIHCYFNDPQPEGFPMRTDRELPANVHILPTGLNGF